MDHITTGSFESHPSIDEHNKMDFLEPSSIFMLICKHLLSTMETYWQASRDQNNILHVSILTNMDKQHLMNMEIALYYSN